MRWRLQQTNKQAHTRLRRASLPAVLRPSARGSLYCPFRRQRCTPSARHSARCALGVRLIRARGGASQQRAARHSQCSIGAGRDRRPSAARPRARRCVAGKADWMPAHTPCAAPLASLTACCRRAEAVAADDARGARSRHGPVRRTARALRAAVPSGEPSGFQSVHVRPIRRHCPTRRLRGTVSPWDALPPCALPSCAGYLARWDIELRGI